MIKFIKRMRWPTMLLAGLLSAAFIMHLIVGQYAAAAYTFIIFCMMLIIESYNHMCEDLLKDMGEVLDLAKLVADTTNKEMANVRQAIQAAQARSFGEST